MVPLSVSAGEKETKRCNFILFSHDVLQIAACVNELLNSKNRKRLFTFIIFVTQPNNNGPVWSLFAHGLHMIIATLYQD